MFSLLLMSRRLVVSFIAALLLASGTISAQESVDPNTVVITVNGLEITQADIDLTLEQFAGELQNAPPEAARQVAAQYLVELKILVAAAEAAELAQSPDFQLRMRFLRDQALRERYLATEIDQAISEADIEAAYEQQIADFEPAEEISARHILVESEEEARALIAQLDGGADFAALASEKSIGPSKAQGGSLGFFGRGQMVPEFETAAFEMVEGAHSAQPVQTQFGWHIIKVEEKRETSPPALESLRERLLMGLRRSAYQSKLQELTAAASIDYVDDALMPAQ